MAAVREVAFGYRPLAVHTPFHQSSARYKLAIGGVGSGKSVALCAEAIAFGLEQPGSDMMLTRRYVPHLRDSTENIFFDLLPSDLRDAGSTLRMGGHYDSYAFPNGSKIMFRGLEDWKKYKSMNLAWIGFDEADEQSEANVVGMSTRLRQTRPLREALERGYRTPRGGAMRQQICLASNPNGKDWLYHAFDPEHKGLTTKWADSACFLSTSLDNPYLPGDYLDDLMSRPIQFVRRYVLTQFDKAGGQIFETWNWEEHIVPAPNRGVMFPLRQGMDPGMSTVSPCASLWCVVDRAKGRLIGVREYQEPGRAVRQHAAAWREVEKQLLPWKVQKRVADPKISARDNNAQTLSDLYRRQGFTFQPGALRHAVRIPALDELIRTGRFVLTEDCPMTYEQIANARWEDQLPQHADAGEYREVVRKGEDHLSDAAGYLASEFIQTVSASAAPVEKTEEQHWHEEIKAKILRQARGSGTMRDAAAADGNIV